MHAKLLKTLVFALVAATSQVQATDSKSALSATITKKPENQLRTSDGRTFMTAESGIYEVVDSANGKLLQPLSVVYRTLANGKIPADNTPCYFLGLVQRGNNVITTCAVDLNNALSTRYLLALDLADSTRTVREIGQLVNIGMPNGMAIDPQGRVYLSDSGALLNSGKIVRINFNGSNPMLGFLQSTWLSRLGHPNGLKATATGVYFTEATTLYTTSGVYRAEVKADGSAGTVTKLYGGSTVFDDLILVKDGLVVADYNNKHIIHLNESGQLLHSSTTEFVKPSSMLFDSQQIAPWSTLWVTERDSGNYSVFTQDWGLQPR